MKRKQLSITLILGLILSLLLTTPAWAAIANLKLNDPLPAGGNVGMHAAFLRGIAISPDGSRVVYMADQDTAETYELYVSYEAAPDLAITKNGPATADPGDLITYTLTITNSGTISATNLVITDAIPSGANYVSGGARVDDTVSWTVSSLAENNGSVQVTFSHDRKQHHQ